MSEVKYTIDQIGIRLDNLQRAFIQSQINQVSQTYKTDSNSNKISAITPYTDTKTAYIGDTEITFFNTPDGNLTVYFPHPYTVERLTDRIIISFEELEEVTDITISIL